MSLTPYERAKRRSRRERRPAATESFWAELLLLRERWEVFRHPLYARWACGELAGSELRDSAEEHVHLVAGLGTVARHAAGKANGLLCECPCGARFRDGRPASSSGASSHRRPAGWRAGRGITRPSGTPRRSPAPSATPAGAVLDLVTLVAAEPEPDDVVCAGIAGLVVAEDRCVLLAQAEAVQSSYWTMLDALEGAKEI